MNTMGGRIRELRKDNNMTQQEITDKLNNYGINIGRTGYQAYEVDRVEPSRKVLKALADIFDTDIDYLIGRIDPSIITEDTVPDLKRQLDTIMYELEEKEELLYADKPINNMARMLLKTSLEQAMKFAATALDEGAIKVKNTSVAVETQ